MNSIHANKMISNETLSMKAAAVLNNLILHSNKSNECFPALRTIARECKMSIRTVQRGLDELLSIGLVTKKHNYRENGSQTSNIYKIITAIEERAAAIEANAMQKLQDLRRKMEAAKAKQSQLRYSCSASLQDNNKNKSDNSLISIIHGFVKSLKIRNLTIPPSQIDYPRT